MKNLLTLLFLLLSCNSFGQRTVFGVNNNYVAPVAAAFQAPAIFILDLLLNFDVENPVNYLGNTWKGDINTALIYKRGLSNTEILQNFNALKSRFSL